MPRTAPQTTCPDWCTVDHATDGYSQHGHVVHRAFTKTEDGHRIDYWRSTAHAGVPRLEPPEVHIGELNQRFSDPAALRRYAYDLLDAANRLDEITGSEW